MFLIRPSPPLHTLRHLSLRHITTSPSASTPLQNATPCACTLSSLDVDLTTPLTNSRPRYGLHLLLHKGTPASSWPSRLEDTGDLTKPLKLATVLWPSIAATGAASITAIDSAPKEGYAVTVTHVPSMKRVSFPEGMAVGEISAVLRDVGRGEGAEGVLVEEVEGVLVVVCGHGARDNRCGVLGPIIVEEARVALGRGERRGEVVLSAHIGGHKWAGNIIVYEKKGGKVRGDWYGRVGPGDVERVLEARERGEIWERERCYRGGVEWDLSQPVPRPSYPQ